MLADGITVRKLCAVDVVLGQQLKVRLGIAIEMRGRINKANAMRDKENEQLVNVDKLANHTWLRRLIILVRENLNVFNR